MSYIDFESDGVEYRLILSIHGSVRKEPIDGLDALVLETGSIDPISYAPDIPKSKEILNYINEFVENDIPIYSVDNCRRDFLRTRATHFGHMFALPAMAYGISRLAGADDDIAYTVAVCTLCAEMAIMELPVFLGNGISKFFAKANSVFSLLRQAPLEELRNALTARKIKNGVVPYLLEHYSERFEGRKPRIGILYGAGHSGIKECLESDWRSSLSLGLHRHYGLRFILDRNTLRDFYEYRIDSSGNVTYQKLQVESI